MGPRIWRLSRPDYPRWAHLALVKFFFFQTYPQKTHIKTFFMAGKLIGSLCAVCGILVMALPIPIVVDNFADYYQEQKKLEAKELKKEAQARQAEVDIEAE